MDLTLAGEAVRVTEPAILEQVARSYRGTGWPAGAAGDGFTAPYSAPGAGPPPWHRYQFTFHTVIGLSTTEPNARHAGGSADDDTLRPLLPDEAAAMGDTHPPPAGRSTRTPAAKAIWPGQPILSHPDLPLPFHADAPHRRVPAREGQRGPDRALPPGPSRSARPLFPVAGRGDPRTVRRCRRGRLPARDDLAAGLGRRTPAVTPRVRSRRSWEHCPLP